MRKDEIVSNKMKRYEVRKYEMVSYNMRIKWDEIMRLEMRLKIKILDEIRKI